MEKRLTPARSDLAARFLEGEVEADRFVDAQAVQVVAAATALRRSPSEDAPLDTELLFGEVFDTYETKDGWCWGQATLDGYVGYVSASEITENIFEPTHRVTNLRTYVYAQPDLKSRPEQLLSMGSKVEVQGTSDRFSDIGRGFIHSGHLCPVADVIDDWVTVAESFLGTPYFWGGRQSLGLDCSSLVQLALEQKGLSVPRDSDLQAQEIGQDVLANERCRGDLVFWKGHVGIMTSETDFVHANATNMCVTVDDLESFSALIRDAEGPITAAKRLE